MNNYQPAFDKVFLNIQSRMHPKIAEFPNTTFYEEEIFNAGITRYLDKHLITFWEYNTTSKPILFWDSPGIENNESNQEEAEKVIYLLFMMLSLEINPKDIGVITFYNSQKTLILNKLNTYKEFHIDEKELDIEVNTVDSYQGREKKYIILSTVRSKLLSSDDNFTSKNPLGFTADPKRMNVALSRAKAGMFIVGNSEYLAAHDSKWKALVEFYKSENCLRKMIIPK